MTADRFQKNGLGVFVLNELKNNAEIVAGAARPGMLEFSLQLMGF